MKYIDIYTKGEVVRYIQKLQEEGQIKDCIHIKVKQKYAHAFYPECEEDWAKRVFATNVHLNSTGYGGPSSYHWPECPDDCQLYEKADDFVKSITATKRKEELLSGNYVDKKRIEELRSLKDPKYDIAKLVELCEELNKCYRNKCKLAIAALVRTILNHVPPIFNKENFEEVANNYSWGTGKRKGESKKHLMIALEESARKIADIHLHQKIRNKESLPTITQVDFRNNLDVLLEEIVRIIKA